MAVIVEDTKDAIRNLPIADRLRTVLLAAADAAGVETVRVTSGGQPSAGHRRTGSARHDFGNAADLQLIKGGRALDFTNSVDRPTVAEFVAAAAAAGATGIGAAVDYMGPTTLHVGFGSKAVWGKDGRSVNAPAWLREAVEKGWAGKPAAPSYDRYLVAKALQTALLPVEPRLLVDGKWGKESRDAYDKFNNGG